MKINISTMPSDLTSGCGRDDVDVLLSVRTIDVCSYRSTVPHGSRRQALFYQRRWRTARWTAAARAAADKDVRPVVARMPLGYIPKEEGLLARRASWQRPARVCLSSSARRVGKEVSIRRAELNNSNKSPSLAPLTREHNLCSSCAMRTARRALLLFTWVRVQDGLILGLSLSSYLTPFGLRASISLLNWEMSTKVKLTFVPLRM